MSRKNRQRGKSLERFIAKDLGGRRVGLLGMVDVEAGDYSIETKERKKMPKFIMDSMLQATKNKIGGKLPIVILHELNQSHEKDIVVMWYKNFKDWIYKKW